mgnify:CR=1 FL=1
MDHAVTAIVRFCRLARSNGVSRLEAFATSAVRDASNGGEMISAIHSMTGVEVRILDGQMEAQLSADALRRGLYIENGIIADLGGGSLELAVLRDGKTRDMISLPLGTVRLQSRLKGDMKKMRETIAAELDSVKWLGDHAGNGLFPIGGAWRAFARLKIQDSDYPLDIIHGYTVQTASALETASLLTGFSKQSLMGLDSVVSQRRICIPAHGARQGRRRPAGCGGGGICPAGRTLRKCRRGPAAMAQPGCPDRKPATAAASVRRMRDIGHGMARTPRLSRIVRLRPDHPVPVLRYHPYRAGLSGACGISPVRRKVGRRAGGPYRKPALETRNPPGGDAGIRTQAGLSHFRREPGFPGSVRTGH